MKAPGTKTLDDIRAHARAIDRGSGVYETQMLCRMVIGLADRVEALEALERRAVTPTGSEE